MTMMMIMIMMMMMMIMVTMMAMMIMMCFLNTKGRLTQMPQWGGPINYNDDDVGDKDGDDDDDNNGDDDDDEFSENIFFVGLLYLKLYQTDWRCLKASVRLNQGIRKVGLLELKIILDGLPFHTYLSIKTGEVVFLHIFQIWLWLFY